MSNYVEVLAKNLPNKDMFLFTYPNEKSKSGIISIHSFDSNVFDYIRGSAQYLGKEKVQENKLEDSYWKRIEKYASMHNVTIMEYLNIKNMNRFDERRKEENFIAQKSSGLSQQQIHGIMDRIKKVPRSLFESVSAFMGRGRFINSQEVEREEK